MPSSSTPRLPLGAAKSTLEKYTDGVIGWNRAMLARAITLIESNRHDRQEMAQELLNRLLPHTGRSIRVGLTGVPGAGKSALMEALGCRLTAAGHRVAVLAIDPSSVRSGGSLLGDKTRDVVACRRADPRDAAANQGDPPRRRGRRARSPRRGAVAGARRAGDGPRPALLRDERLGPRGGAVLMCQSYPLTMEASL
jgi:hypothetical protein